MDDMASGILHPRFLANVRAAIAEKGWTQREFAESLGFTEAYVSQILSGRSKPQFPVIEKIAEVLGIDPIDLLQPAAEKISA